MTQALEKKRTKRKWHHRFLARFNTLASSSLARRLHLHLLRYLLSAIHRSSLHSESMIGMRPAIHSVDSILFSRTLALPQHVLAEFAVGRYAFITLNAPVIRKLKCYRYSKIEELGKTVCFKKETERLIFIAAESLQQ